MGGADDDVKIDANRRYVVFTSNGYTIMSRLIEGDFLNYESVIPKGQKTRCRGLQDLHRHDRARSPHYYRAFEEPAAHQFGRGAGDCALPDPLGKVVDEFSLVEMTGDPVEIWLTTGICSMRCAIPSASGWC